MTVSIQKIGVEGSAIPVQINEGCLPLTQCGIICQANFMGFFIDFILKELVYT
jgi:hypothetical protein